MQRGEISTAVETIKVDILLSSCLLCVAGSFQHHQVVHSTITQNEKGKRKKENFFRFAEMSANDGTERETKPSVQGFNRFLFIPGVVVPPPERERESHTNSFSECHTHE